MMTGRGVIATVAAALGVAATAVTMATAPALGSARSAGKSMSPSCTPAALTSALRRSTGDVRTGKLDRTSIACAGSYAAAGEIIGTNAHGFEITVLFHADGTRWKVVPREKPCRNHLVPKAIYRAACLSN